MVPTPIKNHTSSIITISGMLGYFCRKGNKEGVEKMVHSLFFNRLKKPTKIKEQVKWSSTFQTFTRRITPYINLKLKRRKGRHKKKPVYKLQPFSPITSKRKSFMLFSSLVRPSSRKTKPFIQRLSKELDAINTIASAKRQGSRTQTSTVSEVGGNLFKKRDYLHQIAYKAIPYKWTARLKKAKKRATKTKKHRSIGAKKPFYRRYYDTI